MKKLFKRKKKSLGDVGSLASGRSLSGYNVSPKKDLQKIHKAAFDNDIAKLKTLLKKEDINQLDKENRTALHLACAQGNLEAVQTLVNHPQCNLNLCDNDRRSALMKCVQCQFQNCLEVLVNKRADVNLSDENGNTALHLAAAIPSIDACCLLLDSNADVSYKNKEGSTPLHIASSTEGAENLISNLIEDGALVDAVDNSGKTPLMLAASRGFLDIVRILLSHKADASLKDSRGWSADDYASMNGHHPISMIIFENSQTQQKQKNNQTPMGDHIYATVNKKKSSVLPATSSGKFDDDLSLSESSSQSLPSSGSEGFQAEKLKPPVNVAAFMKQLEIKKNAPGGSEKEVGGPPQINLAKDDASFDDDKIVAGALKRGPGSEGATELRSRPYESNSRKGGPVSPNKPPLPGDHSSGDLPRLGGVKLDEDEDSPWDDEDDDLPPAMAVPTTTYNKPDKAVSASLGFSEEDVRDIYRYSSDDSVSHDHDVVGEKDERKKEAESHTVEEEEEVSSLWDDDEVSDKLPDRASTNFLASSALLKFDDEARDPSPPAHDPMLHDQGVLIDSLSEHDSSSHSLKPRAAPREHPAPSSSAQKMFQRNEVVTNPSAHLTGDESTHSDDDDDDDDDISSLESESDWEREKRLRKEQSMKEGAHDAGGGDGARGQSLQAKKTTQKTLAEEAAVAALRRAELRRTKEEENKEQEEEKHRELLASQDREKINAALQAALAGSTEPTVSDTSDVDEGLMGNADSYAKKMADGRSLSIPARKRDVSNKMGNGRMPPRINEADPATWTTSETESDPDEDFAGTIPASLRSSQLSDALIRSAERGELQREAEAAKRKAFDLIEQLEFARRDAEVLKEQVEEHRMLEEEWERVRSDLEATVRKMKFDQSRLNEQAESCQLELQRSKERNRRIEDNLEIESDTRRKCESTIFELEGEMKILEGQLKKLESDKQQLLSDFQQTSMRENLSRDQGRVERAVEEEDSSQLDALNLLVREKDQELVRMKAERDALEEAKDRYRDEARKWGAEGGDRVQVAMQLNDQLNTKVEELSYSLKEKDEKLKEARLQFEMEENLLKQANQAVTEQIKKERRDRENTLHDLEALNQQQGILKKKIEETEEVLRRKENEVASLSGELKGVREQKESLEKRLHGFEVSENSNLQEAGNLRAMLTHKESALTQARREEQDIRERLRGVESELNDFRRENAKLSGRVEMLQADISQQESERLRLRRELDEARNVSNAALTSQHGKLSEIMSANQTERIELEKMNAQLKQQVAYLKEEAGRMVEERLKKEEELARAQQDRIETHKHLSFTESSMAQLTESQQILQRDKQDVSSELQASKTRCAALEDRIEEVNNQMASLRDQLADERQASSIARREAHDQAAAQTRNREEILRLENQVKEAELETEKLRSDLGTSNHRARDARDDRDLMMQSRQQLEELVAKLQDEKVEAEERRREETQRCQMLESEASGHRRMWEEEVRVRSKLSVEMAKLDQERREARDLVESYREKYRKASLQSRSYRSKFENGKRRSSKLEQQLEESSRVAAESRARFDSSESECDSRVSRMSRKHERERGRLQADVRHLEARLLTLDQKMRKERESRDAETQGRLTDGSVTELEKERDQLRDEVKRLRSSRVDQSRPSMEANAQVNAKLEQVNAWLEERSVAQEILEKLRFDNEEKRVAEATRRADALQRELDLLRSSHPNLHEEKMRRDLQEATREKIDLQEKLMKSQHDMEEMKMKLDHERKKSAKIRASALSGTIAGSIGTGLHPLPHLSNSLPNQSSIDIMSSTPRKEGTDPMLAQLRHKLDSSIAMRLSSPPPSNADVTGLNRSRPVNNEYFTR